MDDSNTSIGKRYARNDELGTPFGVTLDFACEYGPDDEPAKELTSRIVLAAHSGPEQDDDAAVSEPPTHVRPLRRLRPLIIST